jgi:hypothetical protein
VPAPSRDLRKLPLPAPNVTEVAFVQDVQQKEITLPKDRLRMLGTVHLSQLWDKPGPDQEEARPNLDVNTNISPPPRIYKGFSMEIIILDSTPILNPQMELP